MMVTSRLHLENSVAKLSIWGARRSWEEGGGRGESQNNVSLLPLCWKVIQLDTLVDNLTVDPDTGDILAGCHPNAIKLLMYNTEDPPGSEVSS